MNRIVEVVVTTGLNGRSRKFIIDRWEPGTGLISLLCGPGDCEYFSSNDHVIITIGTDVYNVSDVEYNPVFGIGVFTIHESTAVDKSAGIPTSISVPTIGITSLKRVNDVFVSSGSYRYKVVSYYDKTGGVCASMGHDQFSRIKDELGMCKAVLDDVSYDITDVIYNKFTYNTTLFISPSYDDSPICNTIEDIYRNYKVYKVTELGEIEVSVSKLHKEILQVMINNIK